VRVQPVVAEAQHGVAGEQLVQRLLIMDEEGVLEERLQFLAGPAPSAN
jgi:hypothetical protein